MSRALAALIGATLAAAPAAAVGLGPLRVDGATASDRKGFYLTLINPYPSAERFRLVAVGSDDELPQPRVTIMLDRPLLAGGGQRRILVIATGLAPGETYHFRVCAEREDSSPKELIHARVCSKLSARRLG